MMMEPVIVKRAANMTAADRKLIVELVAKYASVVENKNKSVSNEEKEAGWRQVCDEFNAVSATKRELKQLRHVSDLCTMSIVFSCINL